MPIYTRCPKCETTFALTRKQLDARAGLVRCGRCGTVFHAEQLSTDGVFPGDQLDNIDQAPPAPVRRPTKRSGKRAGAQGARSKSKPSDAAAQDSTSSVEVEADANLNLFDAAPMARTRTPFWILGIALLVLTMFGQLVFFYGGQVSVKFPSLRPLLDPLCKVLTCSLTPPQKVELIDLVEAQVTPHPKFDRALRVKATLVNRANYPQAYPQLEVSLSTNKGLVIARRSFAPSDYLSPEQDARSGMPPYVAVNVMLDITHPDKRASGYEIRVLPTP